MSWIDRYEEGQRAEEARRRSALEQERARAREVATAFRDVTERLQPRIRTAIDEIKVRLGVVLRLEVGEDHLVIDHGDKKPFSKHYFISIAKLEPGPELFVEATEDGAKYTPVPDHWEGSLADWRGADPPSLQLRTNLNDLETRQLEPLLEWITAAALRKGQELPFQAEALAQRKSEEKAQEKKWRRTINLEKDASRAFWFALFSIPCLVLSPVALGIGLLARWRILKAGRVEGLTMANRAIGISAVTLVAALILLLAEWLRPIWLAQR